MRRYGAPIRAFLARRIRNPADINDLTQEVFLRLMRRTGAGPIENIEGYLFQIAANLLRETARQAALRDGAFPKELAPEFLREGEDYSPERILLGKEACRELVAALNELPERTRTVFILSRFEDVKGYEIARRLGISVSAVEKHMMRALRRLRERMPS